MLLSIVLFCTSSEGISAIYSFYAFVKIYLPDLETDHAQVSEMKCQGCAMVLTQTPTSARD